MFALRNEVRRYAWGSRTAMAEFLGRAAPGDEPEAELWIGAYAESPSRLPDDRTLPQLIEADPLAALGAEAVGRFGPRLPFLMKVLTIGSPLSLQTHPNAAQAEAGFAAEQAAGVPIDDPTRNYRDARHKPEMLCALTPVEAFSGFRPIAEALALLDELSVRELDGLRQRLSASGLRGSVSWIFGSSDDAVPRIISAVKESLSARAGRASSYARELQWILRLAEDYPQDRGVILALLCNFVRLEPGEALYIPAGCLHAYLSGVGVEIMAESDNVLRGGLTAKHVDVVDLQGVLDLNGDGPKLLRGVPDSTGRTSFPTDVAEFDLIRRSITDAVVLEGSRPRLILSVDGSAAFSGWNGARPAARCGRIRIRGRAWHPDQRTRRRVRGQHRSVAALRLVDLRYRADDLRHRLVDGEIVSVDDDESVVRGRRTQAGVFRIHSVHVVTPGGCARLGTRHPTPVSHRPGRPQLHQVDPGIGRQQVSEGDVLRVCVGNAAGNHVAIARCPEVQDELGDVAPEQLQKGRVHETRIHLANVLGIDLGPRAGER